MVNVRIHTPLIVESAEPMPKYMIIMTSQVLAIY